MKTYFEYKGYKVADYKDKSFAKYVVVGTTRCFDDLESAICYCIGIGMGKASDSQLMSYVDTFVTLINKSFGGKNQQL